MFRCLVIVVVLVSGCASKHEFVMKCRGPLVVLNTDKWQPTQSDVAAFEKLCPEDK
jgi:hypothetical protein